MNSEQIFTLIDKSLPLLGVVIGAFLTPLVADIIATKKRKHAIQNELLENISQFYKGWISVMRESNYFGFYNKIQSLMWFDIQKDHLAGNPDIFRDRQLAAYVERELRHSNLLDQRYQDLGLLDTRIKSLLWEYRKLNGDKKFKKLKFLLEADLTAALTRGGSYLYEYLTFDLQKCDEVAGELPIKVLIRSGEITERMYQVMKQTEQIFG